MIAIFLLCFFVLPPNFFYSLIFIISLFLIYELATLLDPYWKSLNFKNSKIIFHSFAVFSLILVFSSHYFSYHNLHFLISIGIFSWFIFIPFLLLQNKSSNESFKSISVFFFRNNIRLAPYFDITNFLSLFLIIPLTASLVYLFAADKMYLLFVLIIIWIADIGAYFSGRTFGKIKIAKEISPGKTLEGVLGAIILNILFMIIIGFYFSEFNYINGIIFSVVITILSVMGDLFESWLKRGANVKDSSNFIPGHGGFMDRLDSLFPTIPVCAILYNYISFTL